MENTENIENSTVELPAEPTVSGVEEGQAPVIQGENTNNIEEFNDGDKFAKAFSKRFNKEKEKLTKQFEPFKKVVSLAAKQFGMDESEYIESILNDYQDDSTEANIKEIDEKDALIEELLAEKRDKEIAQQWEKQARALQEIDARVSMESITDEMLSLSQEKGIPLEYIYAFEMLTKNREQFEKEIEDKVMAKINKVNITGGSITSGQVNNTAPSISSMSSKDFNDLKERVKRGEKVNF